MFSVWICCIFTLLSRKGCSCVRSQNCKSSNKSRWIWKGCKNKMAAKLALSSLHQRLWSSGCAGFISRGGGGSEADSDRSEGVELLGPLFCLRSSSCTATADRRVLVWRRRAVRCEAEIKDDQSLATQQAEVITHVGGVDFMTSWWNNGEVDLFLLLCCKNNRTAKWSLSFSVISRVACWQCGKNKNKIES